MMNRFPFPALLTLLLLNCLGGRATCQISSVGRELVETVLEQLGRREATDLAKFGGEAAVREVFDKAVQEGGESAARQLASYAEKYGVAALRAAEISPGSMLMALRGVGEDLVGPAIYAAARDPAVVTKLVAEYGDQALALAAKHPGVGPKIAGILGHDGIETGLKIPTPQAVRLARYADDIAAAPVPGASKKAVLQAIGKAPGRVLDEIEKHPRILYTAAGCATLVALTHDQGDRLFGNPQSPGLIDRGLDKVLATFRQPVSAVIVVCGLCIVAWSGTKIWLTIMTLRKARSEH